MGFVKGSPKACHLIGLLFILNCGFGAFGQESNDEERQIYVVHLGERQHDDPELVAQSHHKMLESVFESAEEAREAIIYNYHHGFSGFSAKLTKLQAKKLSDRPDVFSVAKNRKFQMQSTRIPEYLGVSPIYPKGILQESDMGSELVIGFVDSGIWPENPAFNDEGLGPIPKHWKGTCVAGKGFDPAKHCNKKIVGAKFFLDDWEKRNPGLTLSPGDFLSPRGSGAHGSCVASLAAASVVPNVSYKGVLAPGNMRGVAPKARIAVYKVIWEANPFAAALSSLMKTFDEAVKDKVDVLSVSLGGSIPIKPLYTIGEEMDIGSFHVVNNGIPFVTGASNFGPGAYSVDNVAPWVITVGGTSLDRTYYVDMTFGNNITMLGQAAYVGNETSADLVYIDDYTDNTSLERAKGKVGLTFLRKDTDSLEAALGMTSSGAVGVIVARTSDGLADGVLQEPLISVDYEVGYKILRYIRSSSSPTIKISRGKTLVGRPLATTVSGFSCRGPSTISPAILKPDVVAPGMMIFAAAPLNSEYPGGTTLNTGTSFATPVVAGVVTLLKALHPDWSPAALKSALMTTASRSDPFGEPIFAEGNPRKLADPFDYGAGMVNPEKAKDPGLVYDMNIDDYIHYLCAMGYDDTSITVLTGKPTKCSSPLPSMLDVNYPAITIPDLKKEVTLTRTVTNVGPVDSVYKAIIEPPQGIEVVVEPESLVFNSSVKKLGFKVRVSSSHKSDTGYFFGSFTWTDGTRNVTIPLSVRPKP